MLFWLPIIVSSLIGGGNAVEIPAVMSSHGHERLVLSSETLVGMADAAEGNASGTTLPSPSQTPLPFSMGQHGGIGGGASLAVLLSSIPFIVTAIATILLGRSSQAWGERTLHLTIPYLCSGLLFAGLSPYECGTMMSVAKDFAPIDPSRYPASCPS